LPEELRPRTLSSVTRRLHSLATGRRAPVLLLGVAVALSVFAASSRSADAKDGGPEMRAAGTCGSRATSELRLKSRDREIEVRFEVDHARAGVRWRIAVVHERRIAWKGAATTRRSGSFELTRTLVDLPGADVVTATAWGPQGLVCRATAALADVSNG
jgi:hypothetical protein